MGEITAVYVAPAAPIDDASEPHEIKGKLEPAAPAPHAKMGKPVRFQ
jgi:hypothetical protein